MSSLVPEHAVADLTSRLGAWFAVLAETPRLALITAQVEGVVSHDRLKQISTDHPADLTKLLGTLVRDGLLASHGAGRGTVYVLPWQRHSPAAVFDRVDSESGLRDLSQRPPELGIKPPELGTKSPELDSKSPELPLCLDWAVIPVALQNILTSLATPVAASGKVKARVLSAVICDLCRDRFLGLRVLARALNRDPDDLRKRTLTPMVKAGTLRAAYPANSDPRQAYTASDAEG